MSIVCLLGVWVCLCVLYKRVRCACLLLCGVVKCVADVCCVCFFWGVCLCMWLSLNKYVCNVLAMWRVMLCVLFAICVCVFG